MKLGFGILSWLALLRRALWRKLRNLSHTQPYCTLHLRIMSVLCHYTNILLMAQTWFFKVFSRGHWNLQSSTWTSEFQTQSEMWKKWSKTYQTNQINYICKSISLISPTNLMVNHIKWRAYLLPCKAPKKWAPVTVEASTIRKIS